MKNRAICIVLLICFIPVLTFAFDDIKDSPVKYEIEELFKGDIVRGVSETEFLPDNPITRAEFATIIDRALALTEGTYEYNFSDVPDSAWYAVSVSNIAKLGLMNGYEGNFNPNDNITNEQIYKILVLAYEKYAEKISSPLAYGTFLNDYLEISDWAKIYVGKAAMIGFLIYSQDEKSSNLSPQSFATRGNCAAAVFRTINAAKIYNQATKEEQSE